MSDMTTPYFVRLAATIAALVGLMGAIGCATQSQATQTRESQPTTTTTTPRADSSDKTRPPTVSASAGPAGGVVVLWPRVIPSEGSDALDGVAAQLQGYLADLAAKAVPGKSIETRPKPERTCPQAGCDAIAVGAVLAHREGKGCVAVATVSAPGRSPVRLVPLAGKMEIAHAEVDFREPPESEMNIKDFERCEELLGRIDVIRAGDVERLVDAIRQTSCFSSRVNKEKVEAVKRYTKTIYLTQTNHDGRLVIRFVAGQFDTTEQDMADAFDAIVRVARSLDTGAPTQS